MREVYLELHISLFLSASERIIRSSSNLITHSKVNKVMGSMNVFVNILIPSDILVLLNLCVIFAYNIMINSSVKLTIVQ